MTDAQTIRIFGLVPDSIVDGPGLRYAVFVQGCTHACPGCHNPKSQPSCGGSIYTVEQVINDIATNKLAQGVTLSGGEPFEQAVECALIAKGARDLGLNVWTYSGYRFEDLLALAAHAPENPAASAQAAACESVEGASGTSLECATSEPCPEAAFSVAPPSPLPAVDPAGARDLLAHTDVLVDGPFVEKRHSFRLKWRGSTNQRLIDVAASQAEGRVVLWQAHEEFPEKPASW